MTGSVLNPVDKKPKPVKDPNNLYDLASHKIGNTRT